MEGNLSWEARKVMTGTSSSADALASVMEATAMVDDTRMLVDPVADSETDRAMSSSGASVIDGGDTTTTTTTIESRSIVSSMIQVSSTSGASSSGLSLPRQETAIAGPSRLGISRALLESRRLAIASSKLRLPAKIEDQFSFRKYFKLAYLTGESSTSSSFTPVSPFGAR